MPPHWLQGRTAYGGISAAVALAAIKAAYPILPPLRSAQIAFVGPLVGPVSAAPVLLRRGKNSDFVACDVAGDSGVGLRGLFLFMDLAPRSDLARRASCPDVLLDETALLGPTALPQGFLANFDIAPSRRGASGVTAWRRLKDRTGLDREIELLALADALPPAAMSLATEWRPISTTTWQLNLINANLASSDGWWLLDAQTLRAADGIASQAMTVWNRDGSLTATATQSVALFT